MNDASTPENSQIPDPDFESLELKLPDESIALKDVGLWVGVLTLLTLIAYWPATTGAFIWRDDTTVANTNLLGPTGLSHSWFARWESDAKFDRPIYQPVADTAYWVEYRLGGHDSHGLPTATSFHIASLIFHAGAAILLWFILRELLIPGAWLIAALFAMHPLHAEPVSWISEQPIVLSGLLFLASVYSYLIFVKYRERDVIDRGQGGLGVDPAQTWGFFAGSVVLSIAAMLCHPSALVAPVAIWLLLWWKKRLTSRDSLLLIPLIIIGIALWLSDTDIHKLVTEQILLHEPIANQIGAIGHGFARAGIKLFFPFGLSVISKSADSGFVLLVYQALALLVVLGLIGLYLLQSILGRGILIAAVCFVSLVFFSVNWFDVSRLSNVTDAVAYLSIIPVIAIVVIPISRLRVPGPQPQSVVGVSTFVLMILGALAWAHAYAFQSPVALWRDVLRKNPTSSFAEASLAEQLRLAAIDDASQDIQDATKADLADAIEHAQSALQLDPANSQAQRTWANVLVSQGDIAKAVPHFESATQIDPSNVQIRNEYADSLISLGRFKDSLPQLNEALKLDSNSAIAHRLLGQAYAGLGDSQRAINEEQTALSINPSDMVAQQKLAELQVKAGKYKDAISSYSQIMAASPDQMKRPELWQAIAEIKDKQGDYDPAVQYLQTAAQLSPDDETIKKELEDETKKKNRADATRPATLPAAIKP